MSVRLNPGQQCNSEFAQLQEVVSRFSKSTPVGEVTTAYKQLIDLKDKIRKTINASNMMALVLAQKNVPTLITKCAALIPADQLSALPAAAPAAPVSKAPGQPSVAAAPVPRAVSQISVASKVQAVVPAQLPVAAAVSVAAPVVAIAAAPVADKKDEEVVTVAPQAPLASDISKKRISRLDDQGLRRFDTIRNISRFDTITRIKAGMADPDARLSQIGIRTSQYDEFTKALAELAKGASVKTAAKPTKRPALAGIFSEMAPSPQAASTPSPTILPEPPPSYTSSDFSKPPARLPPVPTKKTVVPADETAVQTASSSSGVAQAAEVSEVAESKPASVETKILIQYKVPFGRTLFIRGEGAGLNWDEGVPLEKVSREGYIHHYQGDDAKPVQFKLFLDDTQGETSENWKIEAGKTQAFKPTFTVYVPIVITYNPKDDDKLFIRGNGPGLSADKGVELKQVNGNRWVYELPKSCDPFEFRIYLNDEIPEPGNPHMTESGSTLGFSFST